LAERYLIQFSIDYDKKILNWLSTSCVVSITTAARGRLRTTYHRQNNKLVAKRLWGCVNAERQHSNTCCNFYAAKHFSIPIETLFV